MKRIPSYGKNMGGLENGLKTGCALKPEKLNFLLDFCVISMNEQTKNPILPAP